MYLNNINTVQWKAVYKLHTPKSGWIAIDKYTIDLSVDNDIITSIDVIVYYLRHIITLIARFRELLNRKRRLQREIIQPLMCS